MDHSTVLIEEKTHNGTVLRRNPLRIGLIGLVTARVILHAGSNGKQLLPATILLFATIRKLGQIVYMEIRVVQNLDTG